MSKSTALVTLTSKLASKFDMGDGTGVSEILKSTAFKGGQVTDDQMTALLVVANQYGLNPFTREIFAFPDKGGIVPVVGVDGWSRIINDHKQFDGMEFDQDDQSCTCIIFRKDRAHAIKVTEYLSECIRTTQPWKSHPKRMLRHKAMIQCARIAFGFGGIFDQDEAERIVEVTGEVIEGEVKEIKTELQPMGDDVLVSVCADKVNDNGEIVKMGFKSKVQSGEKTAQDLIDYLSAKCVLSDDQIKLIKSWDKDGVEE